MKPYLQQSRKIQKRGFITVKNSLKNGGLFTTQDAINEHTQWADIFFLSQKHKNIFYNATIFTTRSAWHDKIYEQSWEDSGLNDKIMKLPSDWMETLHKTEVELASSSKVFVSEEFQFLKPKYVFGIGLDMIVHNDNLSVDIINQAIEKFYLLGEINWIGDKLYTFSLEYYNNAYNTINPLVDSKS